MNATKFAEAVSTGAAAMSTFHQLSGGNSGSGPGSAPPAVLAAHSTTSAQAQIAVTTPPIRFVDLDRCTGTSTASAAPAMFCLACAVDFDAKSHFCRPASHFWTIRVVRSIGNERQRDRLAA